MKRGTALVEALAVYMVYFWSTYLLHEKWRPPYIAALSPAIMGEKNGVGDLIISGSTPTMSKPLHKCLLSLIVSINVQKKKRKCYPFSA
jgi:hypothetical protein